MKNLFRSLLVVALVALATSAIAGTVFDRAIISVPATGTATWTNTQQYSGVQLADIWVVSPVAISTATVTRLVSTNNSSYLVGYTGSVVAVVTAAGVGESNLYYSVYKGLKYGEVVSITMTPTTNATIGIEHEVQKH